MLVGVQGHRQDQDDTHDEANEDDHALLVPSLEQHVRVFGLAPYTAATDRGFFSNRNIHRAEEMGVRCVAVPKPGHRSAKWKARERTRAFRRARAWRAGGEARIARLKHTFGMHRTRFKGAGGVRRCALWAGIANNLVAIARHREG